MYNSLEFFQVAAARLLLCFFLLAGIWWYRRKGPLLGYALLAGLSLAVTYLILIVGSQLTWWGLQGDEIFVTANLRRMAGFDWFSDFFYAQLPPFYPPLYFWLVGGFAGMLGLNGIRAAQLGVCAVLFFTPVVAYLWQRWQQQADAPADPLPAWRHLVVALSVLLVSDWTAVIFKPYEYLSAVLVVLWTASLLQHLTHCSGRDRCTWRYGLTGGLLLLTYHFWFFIAVIAVALHLALFPKFFLLKCKKLSLIGGLMAAVSAAYTIPLVLSFARYGIENWQSAFFIFSDFDFYLPFTAPSVFGLFSTVGIVTILALRRRPYVAALGLLLVACYLWQLLNAFGLIFFSQTMLPSKPFLFLGGATLSVAAGYGIGEWASRRLRTRTTMLGAFLLAWVLVSSQLLGGAFLNRSEVREQLRAMQQPLRAEFAEIIPQLSAVLELQNLTILSSGVPQLSAYLPLHYYISYNAHFSHPAAEFSKRLEYLRWLAASATPQEFAQRVQHPAVGTIDALLLYKHADYYPLLFWVDAFPNGGRELEIRIPARLIDRQYFDTVFEDKTFIFLRTRTGV